MLPPHGHHVRPHLRHGKTHGAEGIGDDLRSSARGDLEKGMAKPFNLDEPGGGGRSQNIFAPGDIGIAAGRLSLMNP